MATHRQHQILEAAAACFVRRGFHQSTMQEICREAGLSPGSVYRYYRGKEQIIAAMVERDCAENLELIETVRTHADTTEAFAAMANTALQKLSDQAVCTLHIEVTAEALRNPRMAEIVARSDAANLEALAEIIRHAQARGVIDTQLDARQSAELLIALIEGLALRKGLNPQLDTRAQAPLITTLLERFLQPGAARAPGRREP
jgi:AcrR family transcriptional regulator